MDARDPKADLHSYLRMIREAVVETRRRHRVRRPLTPIGTNLPNGVDWPAHHARLQATAERFRGSAL
jgi:hypothetical protein